MDDKERMEVWHQLHAVLHEDQPYTFLYNPQWLRFVRRDIQNVHPYPVGLHMQEMFVID
jgi:peptide/nickel transport system substrate-binding protein